MSGYRELERQLRESVRRRAASSRHRVARRLTLALVPLVLAGGVAGATQLAHGPKIGERARKLAFRAVTDTRHAPACRPTQRSGPAPVIDDPPRPEATALLPGMASAPAAPTPASALAFARRVAGGPVLGRTVRQVNAGGGLRVLAFVARGQGGLTLVDPGACLRARLARVAVLRPDADDPVRRGAELRLGQLRDTMAGAETLWVFVLPHGPVNGTGGAGSPVEPGHALTDGIMLSGSGTYAGIARPAATSITVRSVRAGHRFRRRVAVHDGLFAFALPAHTGPMVMAERAADGRVLRTQRLRR
jgi:hypothetical protein